MASSEELVHNPAERVRALVRFANQVDIDHEIQPKKYFRSGVEMERMANVYFDEGNLESAFILYSKLIILFVEKLPSHPAYSQTLPKDKQDTKKRINRAFKIAEELKQVLKKKYDEEFKHWQADQEKKRVEEEERRKHEAEVKAIKEEQERLEAQHRIEQQLKEQEKQKQQQAVQPENVTPVIIPSAPNLIGDFPTPPVEPKASAPQNSVVGDNFRNQEQPSTNTFASLFSVDSGPPSVNRENKPSLTASDSSTASGLRRIDVPSDLTSSFLHIASPNTRQNLETCGILAGNLKQNKFCITHLLIPKQTSTSDSCTTLNEEDLFDYQDTHSLITLGWIHTHPSQTAFMSSIDLHTHCSYQLMLPEAIAIVVAPKFSETGSFSLTQDYGLRFIANCKKPGFHPHPKEPPLYEDCNHVTWNPNTRIVVADLR